MPGGMRRVIAHHPSKSLMFPLENRTPWPELMSSDVAGNRIKSSHSRGRWRKNGAALKGITVQLSVVHYMDVTGG